MSICGKKRRYLAGVQAIKSRLFPYIYRKYLYILSSSITRGVLRCLLGFLALWGQKSCGGNYSFRYIYFLGFRNRFGYRFVTPPGLPLCYLASLHITSSTVFYKIFECLCNAFTHRFHTLCLNRLKLRTLL